MHVTLRRGRRLVAAVSLGVLGCGQPAPPRAASPAATVSPTQATTVSPTQAAASEKPPEVSQPSPPPAPPLKTYERELDALRAQPLAGIALVRGDALFASSAAAAKALGARREDRALNQCIEKMSSSKRSRSHTAYVEAVKKRAQRGRAVQIVRDMGEVVRVRMRRAKEAPMLRWFMPGHDIELYVQRKELLAVLTKAVTVQHDDGTGYVLEAGLELDETLLPADSKLRKLVQPVDLASVGFSFPPAGQVVPLDASKLGATLACHNNQPISPSPDPYLGARPGYGGGECSLRNGSELVLGSLRPGADSLQRDTPAPYVQVREAKGLQDQAFVDVTLQSAVIRVLAATYVLMPYPMGGRAYSPGNSEAVYEIRPAPTPVYFASGLAAGTLQGGAILRDVTHAGDKVCVPHANLSEPLCYKAADGVQRTSPSLDDPCDLL